MHYYLSPDAVLKWLETPCVYHMQNDELYELDSESFQFLKQCSTETGGSTNKSDFVDYCIHEKILAANAVHLKRPTLRKSPKPSLRYLELQITDKCNLRCRHCYIGDTGDHELSTALVKNVLAEFEELQGLRVLITGGEPLLHSCFDEINRMLPEFFIRKILFTNGLVLNENILKKLNVHEIQVSIDGLEDAHDSLRGKNSYTRTLDAVKHALDYGFDVSVSTMIHAKNLADFPEMENILKGLGIKEWTVDIPCTAGRFAANKDCHISPSEGGKYLGYGYGGGLHAGASGYGCGLHLMAVTADGKCAKCTFYSEKPLGLVTDSLLKCWEKNRPVKLEDLTCDCEHIESCRGGCRYRAEVSGNPSGKDFYRCAFYDILNEEEYSGIKPE